jgi:hypothetical protein
MKPKSNNKVWVGCLVTALLLVAVLFAGVYSASALESEKHTINITEEKIELTGWVEPEKLYPYIDLPDFGPGVLEEMKMKDPAIVATYGEIPTFVDDKGRRKWLDKLDRLREGIRDKITSYLYPEGAVIAYGYNVNGFSFVEFIEGSHFDKTLMDEIYQVVDKEAKEIGIEEVPVVFRVGSLPKLDSGRDDVYRPIIGGVQVQNYDKGSVFQSTLGFSAKKAGTYGYVVAGHLGKDRPTPTGMKIYQPTYPTYPAGTVSDTGGTYADASWVPYDDVSPQIHIGGSITHVDFYTDPTVGMGVYKSGITTGLTYGTVVEERDVTSPTHGLLYDQFTANYDSAAGDSGSPVYTTFTTPTYRRGIVGIHWGRISTIFWKS